MRRDRFCSRSSADILERSDRLHGAGAVLKTPEMFLSLPILALWPQFIAASTQEVIPSGSTLTLAGITYYVPSKLISSLRIHFPDHLADPQFTPVTVTTSTISVDNYNSDDLRSLRTTFLEQDDVFQESFLQVVLVQDINNTSHTDAHKSVDNSTVMSLSLQHERDRIPNGPYFLSPQGYLHRAYRLYSDFQGAFSLPSLQSPDGSSHSVPSAHLPDLYLSIAVDSRLHYTKTKDKPLAGLRLGIKDIFDVKGLKTSLGNRAWDELYPPANDTATAVQRLIDAGAVVMGKMKTSQFAIGETATADWVDLHAPFNPRGDGYQDPSSSSAGPAAGIASYEWLDLALGSDTGGSIRSPSQVNGIFGNRPSHGLIDLDHTMPIAPELDTAGLFARDPHLWHEAAKVLYESHMTTVDAFPTSILTLDYPATINSSFTRAVTTFLSSVATFLGPNTTNIALNISSEWSSVNASLPSLNEYFNKIYDIITSSRQASLVQQRLHADYAALHDDRTPFIDPGVQGRWTAAENYTDTMLSSELAKVDLFTTWLNSEILPPDPTTCSRHLLIYVRGEPKPKYRNTYLPGVTPPSSGFSASRMAVFGQVPDFVIPIGEVKYESTITGQEEVLPLTVNLVARRGCDGMLFELVERLYDAGIVKRAEAGRSLVTGGEILR